MKKLIYIILLFFIVTNCTLKKVSKNHGVPFLEEKEKKLFINQTNKNDIINIIGYPSTKSKFNEDVWIYIERQQTQSELKKLGKMVIYNNKVLVLEIDDKGILKKKELYSLEDMENIKIAKETTDSTYKGNSFIYEFMSSMRQKINDPLGQRAKKRKEITNQR